MTDNINSSPASQKIYTPDYTDKFKNSQLIHANYFYKKPFDLVHGRKMTII
jgi:hypothetical protein